MSRPALYEIGFVPSRAASSATPKFIYLLNADEVDPASIPANAFVVYQGHHGDRGAALADVCLPGAAYTEKSATWVNTEGRSQLGRAAVPPPGAAREDWKIVRALADVLEVSLPYDDVVGVRDRMWAISPALVRWDGLERTSFEFAKVGLRSLSGIGKKTPSGEKIGPAVSNFYQTDVVSRAYVYLFSGFLQCAYTGVQLCDDGAMHACVRDWRKRVRESSGGDACIVGIEHIYQIT